MKQSSDDWVRAGKYKIKLNQNDKSSMGLSSRESQILGLLVRGYSLKRIAHDMDISPHTADTYKRRLYGKLGVSSAACAIVIAVAHYTGALIESVDTENRVTTTGNA